MIDRPSRNALFLATLLAAACGGSGSTGLLLPEATLLERVRAEGTCVVSGGTEFCATDSPDATTPEGSRAEGGDLFGNDVPGVPPCPSGVGGMCGDAPAAVFAVSGLPAGAACSVAARDASAAGPWSLGALTAVDPAGGRIAFPLPPGLAPADAEIVLLCFATPPAAPRGSVDALTDAGADVAFVPAPR